MATQRNLQPDGGGFEVDESGAPVFQEGFEASELGFLSQVLKRLTDTGDITELQDFLRQGFDPRTKGLIDRGVGQLDELGDRPDAYGEDELNTFRGLISGDFFTDELAGSFRERVRRGLQPARTNIMADLSARGLSTSGGEVSSALGRLGAEENIRFQDIAAQNFLQAIGLGTEGLGAADTAMLNREQVEFGFGANIRDFIENAQMNRVGIGGNLAQMKKQDLMNLANLGIDFRKFQQQQPSDLQSAFGAALPFGIAAATGGFTPTAFENPAAGIGNTGGTGGGYGSGPDLTDLPF